MDMGRIVLGNMTVTISFLFPFFILVIILFYFFAIRRFIRSQRLFKSSAFDAESYFHRVLNSSFSGIVLLVLAILLAEVLHYISFEDFNILSWINFTGILIIYSIRLSIDRESRKIESEKPEFRDDYILKLKKEESQFLEASIISFTVGFAFITIQYSISNHWSWFYQILSILVIPVIEAIAIFSLLFWLIWHFSRTIEEKRENWSSGP